MTLLKKIVENRLEILRKEKQTLSEADVLLRVENALVSGYRPVAFFSSFPLIIAEIKKSSPSKGVIRDDFNVIEIADVYNNAESVKGISVLTEPDFFSGSYDYIKQAKSVTAKPLLMKDFVVDPYQIYMGFLAGASAVLLIASILDDKQVADFLGLAEKLNMDVLFETHSIEEYRRALELDIEIIGINNRNLKTFHTDINNTLSILQAAGKPDGVKVISESGIDSRADVEILLDNNVDGLLIGEAFMKSKDIKGAISCLVGA